MGMDEADVLRNPLLGPLIGRAPVKARPLLLPPAIDGKRVRWRLSQLLVKQGEPMTTAQLKAATGFGHKEISAALAKLIHAGDVRVIDGFMGKRKGYEWIRV